MSYSYVSAVTRSTRHSPEWEPTDLSTTPLNVILAQYYEVVITLSNPLDAADTYLTSDGLRTAAPGVFPAPTLNDWLASLGNASLPVITTMPSSEINAVEYSDVWQAGFTANLADIDRSTETQVTPSALDDLLLTKSGLDMASMSHYILTTVNGFLHLSGGSVDGLYVIDGGKSYRIAKNNHAGILSFYQVGAVSQIPFTEGMVYKPNDQLAYAQSTYVDVGQSLKGKVVLLSLGGYLHALDGAYEKVGDSTIKINTHALSFPERIYQSQRYIDLSSLPLDKGPSGATSQQYTVASLQSDETILAYLKLTQSFVIVVDAKRFYTRTHDLEFSSSPGRFFGTQGSRFPLVGPYGKLYDYRLSKEEDTYVYGTESLQQDHFMFQTTNWREQLSVGPARAGGRAWSKGKGTLLEMGSFV